MLISVTSCTAQTILERPVATVAAREPSSRIRGFGELTLAQRVSSACAAGGVFPEYADRRSEEDLTVEQAEGWDGVSLPRVSFVFSREAVPQLQDDTPPCGFQSRGPRAPIP